MKAIQVLGFSGSLRKGSYNTALLRLAAEVLPANMTLETFDLAPIPMFNEDVRLAGVPEPVKLFKERIAATDALLIATPEYNYSIPGVLKNAIDWASRAAGDLTSGWEAAGYHGRGGSSRNGTGTVPSATGGNSCQHACAEPARGIHPTGLGKI